MKTVILRRSACLILFAVLLALSLTGCGKYVSSYKALGFVHSNTQQAASMSFSSFEGRMVFKLKSKALEHLHYTARLATGSAAVYYDIDGTKKELFSVSAGNDVESSVGPIEKGELYIIVETDGKCEGGDLSFSLAEPTR